MSLRPLVLVCALGLSLVGCGGGGSSTSANPTPVAFSSAAFIGTWKTVAPVCFANFAYNTALFYKLDATAITATTVDVAMTAYTDAACTLKAGKVTDFYSVTFNDGGTSGSIQLAKMAFSSTGFSTSADGGSGISLKKVPDGTASGGSRKYLIGVDGTKFYGTDGAAAVDAEGYPTRILPTPTATKI